MAEKTNEKETEKKPKKEPKGITLTMKQLITLAFGLAALFAVIAVVTWFKVSPAVGVNAAAIAAVVCYVGVRAVLFEKKSG